MEPDPQKEKFFILLGVIWDCILAGQYKEARRAAEELGDHPLAKAWLHDLNELYPPFEFPLSESKVLASFEVGKVWDAIIDERWQDADQLLKSISPEKVDSTWSEFIVAQQDDLDPATVTRLGQAWDAIVDEDWQKAENILNSLAPDKFDPSWREEVNRQKKLALRVIRPVRSKSVSITANASVPKRRQNRAMVALTALLLVAILLLGGSIFVSLPQHPQVTAIALVTFTPSTTPIRTSTSTPSITPTITITQTPPPTIPSNQDVASVANPNNSNNEPVVPMDEIPLAELAGFVLETTEQGDGTPLYQSASNNQLIVARPLAWGERLFLAGDNMFINDQSYLAVVTGYEESGYVLEDSVNLRLVPLDKITSNIQIGMFMSITAEGSGVYLFEEPRRDAEVAAQLSEGETLFLVEGAVTNEYYQWWRVTSDTGASGWILDVPEWWQPFTPSTLTALQDLNTYCADILPSRLDVGMSAQVVDSWGDHRPPLYITPSLDAEQRLRLPEETYLTILDSPYCDAQYTWWHVRTRGGSEGWIMEADLAQDPPRYVIEPLQLTDNLGSNAFDMILFVSDRTGQWEIFRMDTDGSHVQQLTFNSPNLNYSPHLSPDGQKIVYEAYRNGQWDIYVVNVDGSNIQRLTSDGADDRVPSWSPDGQKIAFASHRFGDWDIFVMPADGSAIRQMTVASSYEYFPTWSPDGQELAYQSNKSGTFQIYRQEVDGYEDHAQQVTFGSSDKANPAWSSDGQYIAYYTDFVDKDNNDIYIVSLEDGEVTPIATSRDNEAAPSWSPDGRYLLFHQSNGTIANIARYSLQSRSLSWLTTGRDRNWAPEWD